MARLCDLRHKKQHNETQCNYKGPLSFVCKHTVGLKCILLASKLLIVMILHKFNQHEWLNKINININNLNSEITTFTGIVSHYTNLKLGIFS